MGKKLTDNEILKALEVCSSEGDACESCPCFDHDDLCYITLYKEALNLIIRLKGESNKYRNLSQTQKSELTRLYKQVREQKAEIEGLESRIFALNDTNKMLMDSQEIYWKNRVKEFAERLKKSAKEYAETYVTANLIRPNYIPVVYIDYLLKEMTE